MDTAVCGCGLPDLFDSCCKSNKPNNCLHILIHVLQNHAFDIAVFKLTPLTANTDVKMHQ